MITALIVAGGISQRFGTNKLLEKINDKTIIENTISIFLDNTNVSQIIVACSEEVFNSIRNDYQEKLTHTVPGQTRSDTVRNAFSFIKNDIVLVHDGARPFVSNNLINNLINNLEPNSCVVPSIKVVNSLKLLEDQKVITVNRNNYLQTQTPQCFYTKDLILIYKENTEWEDECQAASENNLKIKFIDGETKNIKITFIEDLKI